MGKSSDNTRLCELANKEKFRKIVRLSCRPAYICMKCGRVADSEKNLCKPKAFDKTL